ncbi:MAG: hypothetical protein ACRCTR_07275 [Actinomycetota bacterium]
MSSPYESAQASSALPSSASAAFSSGISRRPRLASSPAWVAGLVSFFGLMVLALGILPAVVSWLDGLGSFLASAVVILSASAVRLIAGLGAAWVYRFRFGTGTRRDPLLSVAVGVFGSWVFYVCLMMFSSQSTDALTGRMVAELPRWLLEAALGALLVAPGAARRQV